MQILLYVIQLDLFLDISNLNYSTAPSVYASKQLEFLLFYVIFYLLAYFLIETLIGNAN